MGGVPLSWYLALSGCLFALGLLGVIIRRNPLLLLLAIELMLNAANVALIGFSRYWNVTDGHVDPAVKPRDRCERSSQFAVATEDPDLRLGTGFRRQVSSTDRPLELTFDELNASFEFVKRSQTAFEDFDVCLLDAPRFFIGRIFGGAKSL